MRCEARIPENFLENLRKALAPFQLVKLVRLVKEKFPLLKIWSHIAESWPCRCFVCLSPPAVSRSILDGEHAIRQRTAQNHVAADIQCPRRFPVQIQSAQRQRPGDGEFCPGACSRTPVATGVPKLGEPSAFQVNC